MMAMTTVNMTFENTDNDSGGGGDSLDLKLFGTTKSQRYFIKTMRTKTCGVCQMSAAESTKLY